MTDLVAPFVFRHIGKRSVQTIQHDITRDMSPTFPVRRYKNSSKRWWEGPIWYVSTYVDTKSSKRHFGRNIGVSCQKLTTSTTLRDMSPTCRRKVQLSMCLTPLRSPVRLGTCAGSATTMGGRAMQFIPTPEKLGGGRWPAVLCSGG